MSKAKKLIIVESPTKVKAIRKFLGSGYEVAASNGHVRDLPKSQMGIDVEHDYEPKYITIRGKGDLLSALRKQVAKADVIYLATDPDREGEAISWHLIAALKLQDMRDKKFYRITFNEITKKAVKEALEHAREIDMNLVDAQQARRALDRVVGYRISPLLWAKVKRGLSAGRVQSVALRMIADREAEINAFIPEEYWTLDARFTVSGLKKPITAHYMGEAGKDQANREPLRSKEETDRLLALLQDASFTVTEVKVSERVRKAPLPFTTSTLQQEASKVLGFSTLKTMRIAQQLYEGIDVKGNGTVGLITYLRTDSTRISEEAAAMAESFVSSEYGREYCSDGSGRQTAARIQDAHEAIRPSDIQRRPEMMSDSLSRDQYRLYQLIWRRFTASRMTDARYEQTRIRIDAKCADGSDKPFATAFSKLLFDGFLKVYDPGEENEDDEKKTPASIRELIRQGDPLSAPEFEPEQHFTQPAPHYTEASLVKALEEKGIGRPSTYAPTISTILARRYITKEGKNLYLTEVGDVVNDIMIQSFPQIVSPDFTANMEDRLDAVADGKVEWKELLRDFYPSLDQAVVKAQDELSRISIREEESEEICEKCGRRMVIKYGPHGKFLACPGFPECRNTKPYYEKTGVSCPLCGHDIAMMMSKRGRRFYGCTNPACDFMSWQKPTGELCEKCGAPLVEKGNRIACTNPECGFVAQREGADNEQ